MTIETKVNVGGVWKVLSQPQVNVGGVWKTCTSIESNVGGVWKTVWPTPGPSDTISLINTSCADEQDSGADAYITVYGESHATRDGECWYFDGGVFKQNDVILPSTSADDYQMKWDALSGDDPTTTSTAEGVWESLGTDWFNIEWNASGEEELIGSVTVSIRLGTGSVLDTAVWDGTAVSVKPKK